MSARRGWLDLVLKLAGNEESETEVSRGSGPEYWDVLGKATYDLGPRQNLSIHALLSGDSNDLFERELEEGGVEEETTDSSYGNSYLWGRHSAIVGDSALVESMLAGGRVDRNRFTAERGPERDFEIREERTLDMIQARQDGSWQLGDRHYLKAGWEARRYDAEYDYFNEIFNVDSVGDALGVERITSFEGNFDSRHLGVYFADRWRITPRFVVEAGLRWDDFSLTEEDHVSPRVNALFELGGGWQARAGWGLFYQSQRPHELQVEDGETTFFGAERAEHRTLGLERTFSRGDGNWDLRLDAYQRVMDDLRPRYENVLQIFVINPETANDRIRVAPTEAEALGVELFLARRGGGTIDWWVNYAWSEVEDVIDGRKVLRATDQTHAFNLSASWRPDPRWSFSAVWMYHTGWPTTPVSAALGQDETGAPVAVPVIGELRSERLDDYHRLDVRATRRFGTGRRVIELFVDIQNVYNQVNEAGFEVDEGSFTVDEAGNAVYTPTPETWLPIFPSFGVSWSF